MVVTFGPSQAAIPHHHLRESSIYERESQISGWINEYALNTNFTIVIFSNALVVIRDRDVRN